MNFVFDFNYFNKSLETIYKIKYFPNSELISSIREDENIKEENKDEYCNDNKSDLNGSSIVIPIKTVS